MATPIPPHIEKGELEHGLGRTQGQQAHDPLSLPNGAITKLRAKRFKEAVNGLIQQVGDTTKTWGPHIISN